MVQYLHHYYHHFTTTSTATESISKRILEYFLDLLLNPDLGGHWAGPTTVVMTEGRQWAAERYQHYHYQ